MRQTLGWIVLSTALAANGCTSHVLFTEYSHLGLKASFEPNQPTPAEVDIGWRRALFAMVPQKSRSQDPDNRGSVTVTPGQNKGDPIQVEVKPDPNELMSLYSVFRANVGFNDPVCVHHFLATGVAASNLLANENDLRDLSRSLKASEDKNPCGPGQTKDTGTDGAAGKGKQ